MPLTRIYGALSCQDCALCPRLFMTTLGSAGCHPVEQRERAKHREQWGSPNSGLHMSPLNPDGGVNRQHILLSEEGDIHRTSGLTWSPDCAFSPSLYNNQITDIGARYVARILDECRRLTHLK
jgi:hypothetical protein